MSEIYDRVRFYVREWVRRLQVQFSVQDRTFLRIQLTFFRVPLSVSLMNIR